MDNITKYKFKKVFSIDRLITLFYMEFSKDFHYDGEKHDFWELVYIDKGEMLCTAEDNSFVLKSGELTFHRPNEYHNLSANGVDAPNVSVINFECHSREMNFFSGKIFKLDRDEKAILSMLITEGTSYYRMNSRFDPLDTRMTEIENAPLGSSQMTKNLLEVFLIMLRRNTELINKKTRRRLTIDASGDEYGIKEIMDYIEDNLYEKISISDIAVALGKSESTVKKTFAAFRAGGVINYFNERRIAEAKRLIREGRYNFSQISDMLHFDTPQYFSKCFKQYASMTPSEYKSSIL